MSIYTRKNKFRRTESSSVSDQLQELQNCASTIKSGDSGIFVVHSKVTDFIYVGRAEINFEKKWHQYTLDLKKHRHSNWMLQLLFDRHGLDNLGFYIIEYCAPDDCLKRESYYVNNLEPELNINYLLGTFGFDFKSMEEQDKVWKEWMQTEEGKEYKRNTIGKKREKWAKTPVGRSTIRQDLKTLRERLHNMNLTDEEKEAKINDYYNEYFPNRTIKKKQPITGDNQKEISANTSKFVIPTKPIPLVEPTKGIKDIKSTQPNYVDRPPKPVNNDNLAKSFKVHKPSEPVRPYKPKSKAQLKREANEQANNFMGCFWFVIVILIIWFLIWLF